LNRQTILGGKVQLFQRSEGGIWHCSASVGNAQHRKSTGQESLARAREVAEDWYLDLRGKNRVGALKTKRGKTFREAADLFLREYTALNEGRRSPVYIQGHHTRVRAHLLPFFGDFTLAEVTAGRIQEYRIHRMESRKNGKPPARNTIHQEMVTLRQILKTALRRDWIKHLPDMSFDYQKETKISHRAWFSPEEYKQLYEATRRRAQTPLNPRYKRHGEQLHDLVLFMANTGLRPDEALRLEHRDVEIVEDEATDETILLISVRGKRGVGYCKSMPGAVRPYQRIFKRSSPEPIDLVFPDSHTEMFNRILVEEGLKFDREGNRRTLYSLRHTYICLRLMEGADIYQIAKNCRTSVEMIEKYYASHIASTLDTAAINVRRPKKSKAAIVAEDDDI